MSLVHCAWKTSSRTLRNKSIKIGSSDRALTISTLLARLVPTERSLELAKRSIISSTRANSRTMYTMVLVDSFTLMETSILAIGWMVRDLAMENL